MTQDITNTPAIHIHNGLEYHVHESGLCFVLDPEEPDVWREKGPAAELLPAALLPKQDEVLHCTTCGTPIFDVELGFFCSDQCHEEWTTL